MKIVVDGVLFQLTNSAISRVWELVLLRLAGYPDTKIVVLDRGNCSLAGDTECVPFPAYTSFSNAADSLLIERFCQNLGADAFISTYYSTPVSIPSVLLVHDMFPEVLAVDLNLRGPMEKQIAISYASHYVCVSEKIRRDLLRTYPAIPEVRTEVVHCGLDRGVFKLNGPAGQTDGYDWDLMANAIRGRLAAACAEPTHSAAQRFYAEWERLRRIQAEVDTLS